MIAATTRTETQLAADVVWLLLVEGVIDRRRFSAAQIAEAVGCSAEELAKAKDRCEALGVDCLRAVEGPPAGPREPAAPARSIARGEPVRAFSERACRRCGEWFPVEQFERLPGAPRRRSGLCPICAEAADRDHFVAIRKAAPLHQVIAFVNAMEADATAGMACGKCGEPIRLGDPISIQAEPQHASCPKVRRR